MITPEIIDTTAIIGTIILITAIFFAIDNDEGIQ